MLQLTHWPLFGRAEWEKLLNVELRDLRWALITSRHRSLRQAAATLQVRQSTLSRRLRDLEYQVGAELFERTNGGTHPTAMGRVFLEAARRIVDDTDAVCARLKAMSLGQAGRLTIGVYVSLAAGNLKATLAEYHRRFPEVDVYTVDGAHEGLLSDAMAGTVDVAVLTLSSSGWHDRKLPLWSERVIAAVPDDHPLSQNPLLHWSDLTGHTLLVEQHGAGPEMQRLLESKLASFGTQRLLHQDVSGDRLMSLAAAGIGIYLMLEGGTGARYDGVTYREVVDQDGPTRLNFAAYWREANTNPTLAAFLDILKERYPDLTVAKS